MGMKDILSEQLEKIRPSEKELSEMNRVSSDFIKNYCNRTFVDNFDEAKTEYKLKSFKGVKAYVFQCGKCGEKIGITKKMKELKK